MEINYTKNNDKIVNIYLKPKDAYIKVVAVLYDTLYMQYMQFVEYFNGLSNEICINIEQNIHQM